MKANLSKMLRNGVALVLAICMIVGFVPAAAFATEAEKDVINYVSFGDSMTNGYGLTGYEGNSGVFDYGYTSYANQFAAHLAGADFEEELKSAEHGFGYHFTGPNADVNHYQLAMSGCRSEDLNFLLRFDFSDAAVDFVNRGAATEGAGFGWVEFVDQYKEEWYQLFDAGDMRTFTDICNCDDRATTAATFLLASEMEPEWVKRWADEADVAAAKQKVENLLANPDYKTVEFDTWGNHIPIAAEYYQNAVKKANVISLALGNTNFGTFIFNEITAATMENSDKPINFRVEDAIRTLSPEAQAKVLELRDKLYVAANNYLEGMDLSPEIEGADMYDNLANILVYGILSYYVNYVGAVEAILEMNEDVEIIQVALMNTFVDKGAAADVEEPTLGDLLDILYPIVNASLAALPTYMQAKGQWEKATFYYAEAPEVQCMVEVYGDDFYTYNDEFIDYDERVNYQPGELKSNPNSIIRQRFFRDLMAMLKDMLELTEVQGVALDYVNTTYQGLCEYDAMTDAEKASFAYADKSKAMTYAIYLAFEQAAIDAGKNSPVTIEAVMNLANNIGMTAEFFAKVKTALEAQGPAYKEAAAAAIAEIMNDIITAHGVNGFKGTATKDHILAIAGGLMTPDQVALAIAKDPKNAEAIEKSAKEGVYAMITEAQYEEKYNLYAAANGISTPWALFKQYGGDKYTAFVETVKAGAWELYKDTALATAISTAAGKIAPQLPGAVGNITSLCALLAIPNAIGGELVADPTYNSLLCLNARTQIGTGLGGHPSPTGHKDLTKAVVGAYGNYTSKDETIKNLEIALDALADIIEKYAPGMAQSVWTQWENAGYIDIVNKALDDLKQVDFEAYKTAIFEINKAIEALGGEKDALVGELKILKDELAAKQAELDKVIAEQEIADVYVPDIKIDVQIGGNTQTIVPEHEHHAGSSENIKEELEHAIEDLEHAIAVAEALIADITADIEDMVALAEQIAAAVAELEKTYVSVMAAAEDLEAAYKAIKEVMTNESAYATAEQFEKAFNSARGAALAAIKVLEEGLDVVAMLEEDVAAKYGIIEAAATELSNKLVNDLPKALGYIFEVDENGNLVHKEYETDAMVLGAIAAAAAKVAQEAKQPLIDAANAKIDELKKEYQPKIDAKKKELKDKKDEIEKEIRDKYENEIEPAIRAEYEEKKIELEGKLPKLEIDRDAVKAELDAKKVELEKTVDEAVRAELQKAIAPLQAQYDRLVKDIETINYDLEHMTQHLDTALAEAYDKVVTEVQKAHQKAVDELNNAIDGLNKDLNDAIDAINKAVDDQIAALEKQIDDQLAAVQKQITDAIDGIIGDIEAELGIDLKGLDNAILALKDALVAAGIDSIESLVDALVAVFNDMLYNATHADLVIDNNFKYVALGDGTAAAEGYAEALKAALDAEAKENGVAAIKFVNAAKAGNTVAAEAANLSADVADAGLITLGFSQTEMMGKAIETLLAGKSVDWAALLGEEAVPYVEKALAKVYAEIDALEMGGMNDAVKALVEAYAYGAMEYAIQMPALINAIRAVNKDAVVVVVGMYNPLANAVIDIKNPMVGEFYMDLSEMGEYFDYVVKAGQAYGIAYAVLTDAIDYVDAPNVAVAQPTLDLAALGGLMDGDVSGLVKALSPSAAGHDYIAAQIADALDITYKQSGLLGDVDGNGKVNGFDLLRLKKYLSGEEVEIVEANSDVTLDGKINGFDLLKLKKYLSAPELYPL